MSNLFVFLLVVFVILQVLDIASTVKAIKSGNGQEANPVAKAIMRPLGALGGAVAIKLIFLSPVVWYAWGTTLDTTENILVLCVVNAIYIYIVKNNFKIANQ